MNLTTPLPTREVRVQRTVATKARRGDRLPIAESLYADVIATRGDAKDNARVFPIVPPIEDWKDDLAAAGIPYLDDMGRQADFHGGTRKTLCTRLHLNRIPLATAMRLMRHTDPKLTLIDYTDETHLAIPALPELETVCGQMRVRNDESQGDATGREATAEAEGDSNAPENKDLGSQCEPAEVKGENSPIETLFIKVLSFVLGRRPCERSFHGFTAQQGQVLCIEKLSTGRGSGAACAGEG